MNNGTGYVPLLKVLRGRPAMLEIGDETRQAVEVVIGHLWDLFFDDTVLLMIVRAEDAVQKPSDVMVQETELYKQQMAAASQIKTGPRPEIKVPAPAWSVYEWQFKWVLTANIIAIKTDGQIRIHTGTRVLTKPKIEPLYNDGKASWSILNNHLSKHILAKLKELGLPEHEDGFKGIYRTEENETVSFDKALFTVPQAAAPAPIPPIQAQPIPAPAPIPLPPAQATAPVPASNVVPLHAPILQ